MWRWALPVVAACSAHVPDEPVPSVPGPTAVTLPLHTGLPDSALPRAITAIHRHPIGIVAVTEDGESAATADLGGAIRVWPALDGTREPFVVPAAPAMELAVARDGDFVIAVVDQAGSLELVRMTTAGQLRARVQVDGEPGVIAVISTNAGFLVERADQIIELVTFDGAHAGRLSPPHRVASVVYRRGRALALFDTGGGRWIDLVGGLRWGGDTAAFTVDPKHAVLSPDHRHLATLANGGLVVVDLATAAIRSPSVESNSFGYIRPGELLGYTEAGELVAGTNDAMIWWSEDGTLLARHTHAYEIELLPFAVGDHRVVVGEQESLRLNTRDAEARYLGYAVGEVLHLRSAANRLAIMFAMHAWLVDADVHHGRLVRTPDLSTIDLVAIDDRTTLELDAIARKRWIAFTGGEPLMAVADTVDVLHYEPTSRLVAFAAGGESTVIRISGHRLGTPMHLHTTTTRMYDDDRIFLVDPTLAQGLVAIVVHDDHVLAIHGDDLTDGDLHPRRDDVYTGAIKTVDRAGRIYVRVSTTDVEVHGATGTVVLHGIEGNPLIAPNADGTLIAVYGGEELSLFRLDGTLTWRVAVPELRELAWHGTELIGTERGIVRFDLVTGEIVDRHCGGAFGLFEAPLPFTGSRGTSCDLQ